MNAFELPVIKKVAIIGPECTGKSDLSNFLAEHFKTVWVPEYARAYIDRLTHPYQEHDLLTIAHGQLRLEDEWLRDAKDVLICDTNLYVIKVWSEFKFGTVHKQILESLATRKYDLYLLTYVDIAWEDDPQREHPEKRQQLYDIYLNEMKQQSVPFVEIKGERDERRKIAVEAIDNLLKKG
ncbi:AAA family ATPase [Pseudochryseolinea flava]|uniref:ATPase n=1 Tax=Pseudochryseolinea flava TaxID=2059302 RepID=A0A364Y6T4_9BACT|nr:ATP-binding protein [Pseudochryseolinea flava]RAW02816.1 ATPase [Pseudochryseolinea flava]